MIHVEKNNTLKHTALSWKQKEKLHFYNTFSEQVDIQQTIKHLT